jgi:hypothetical protein
MLFKNRQLLSRSFAAVALSTLHMSLPELMPDVDRLKKMAIKPSASGSTGAAAEAAAAAAPRPSRQAARSAAAHFSVAGSDCDDDDSPASDDDYSSDPDEVCTD